MNRICEEVQYLDVFAPQAVATATKKTSTFVDTAGADSVEFLIYTGALTSGKKLTVGVTFQHDAGSEVDCAVLAAVRPMYRPPENSWQLVV